jgi:hypothetical protein
MDLKDAKKKYDVQARQAKHRGVPFLITFEEWCYVWEQSGKWYQRGCGRGKYVMSRRGDLGAYEFTNVYIQSHGDNNVEARLGGKHSAETRLKMTNSRIGLTRTTPHPKPKITCPHCDMTGGLSNMKRYHMDNCKLKRD